VERLSAEEGPRLRAIRLRALQDAPDAFGSTFEEAVNRSAESWSVQARDLPTFVAVDDGRDVGMARCDIDTSDATTAWLISMWVAPEMRRVGIGGVLVDAVIDWARSNGANRILLDVANDNAPAVALYDRKGFQPTGEVSALPPPREHIHEHQRELRLRTKP
jgi:GNAT superfamily N-acetyltransferase